MNVELYHREQDYSVSCDVNRETPALPGHAELFHHTFYDW